MKVARDGFIVQIFVRGGGLPVMIPACGPCFGRSFILWFQSIQFSAPARMAGAG